MTLTVPKASAQTAPAASDDGQTRIVGGTEIPLSQVPYVVGLGNCGGTLISPRIVLTAAHCTGPLATRSPIVYAGTDNWWDPSNPDLQYRYPAKVISHPSWDYRTPWEQRAGLDLAVIVMSHPLELGDTVQPVDLATPAELATAVGRSARVSGRGGGSNVYTTVGTLITDEECQTITSDFNDPDIESCWQNMQGIVPCNGDSGSGVMADFGNGLRVAGVAAWTTNDCDTTIVGYADIHDAYDWITSIIDEPETSYATIRGRIVADSNGNEAVDPTDQGIGGVEIEFTTLGLGSAVPGETFTATTNNDGEYSVQVTTGGWVTMTYDKPSDYDFVAGAVTGTNWGPAPSHSLSDGVVTVSDVMVEFDGTYELDTWYDAGAVAPTPTPEPTATPTPEPTSTPTPEPTPFGTVRGTVFSDLDRDGIQGSADSKPLGAVKLYLEPIGDDGSDVTIDPIVASPSFAFEAPPGTYRLRFESNSTATVGATYANEGSDDTVDSDFSPRTASVSPIVVTEGSTQTFDLGILPEQSEIPDVPNIDCDGDLTDADATALLDFLVGARTSTDECPMPDDDRIVSLAGDINLDGETTLSDAVWVARCLGASHHRFCTPYRES